MSVHSRQSSAARRRVAEENDWAHRYEAIDAGLTEAHPLVSVVVPVFNEEANLDEFLRRLLAVMDGRGREAECAVAQEGNRLSNRRKQFRAVTSRSRKAPPISCNGVCCSRTITAS